MNLLRSARKLGLLVFVRLVQISSRRILLTAELHGGWRVFSPGKVWFLKLPTGCPAAIVVHVERMLLQTSLRWTVLRFLTAKLHVGRWVFGPRKVWFLELPTGCPAAIVVHVEGVLSMILVRFIEGIVRTVRRVLIVRLEVLARASGATTTCVISLHRRRRRSCGVGGPRVLAAWIVLFEAILVF